MKGIFTFILIWTTYLSIAQVIGTPDVSQASTVDVVQGSLDQEVIRIEVEVGATAVALTNVRIKFNTVLNSGDYGNASVYFTGGSNVFATTTLLGDIPNSGFATNSAHNITFGAQNLSTGLNYIWVAFDLSPGAIVGNHIDCKIRKIVIDGGDIILESDNPAGVRLIVGGTPISTPGNVGAGNLTAWFRATDLALGNVTSWTTTYPVGGSALTVTDAAAPYPRATNTPANNVSNYNTTIDFSNNLLTGIKALENTSSLNLLDNSSAGSEGTFISSYYLPASAVNGHMVLYNESSNDAIQYRNLGGIGRFAIVRNITNSVDGTRDWTENFLPNVQSFRGNRNSATSLVARENSKVFNNATIPSKSTGPQGLYFGTKPDALDKGLYTGYLNEFIFYNRDLSDLELLKVESYLAIKYGITLDETSIAQGDYLSTDGTTIWDASVAPNYHNDVIGIGRDDNQELEQKQSHSFDDTTRIYLSNLALTNTANTGAFNTDVSYIMAGHNGGAMCDNLAATSEVPAACNLSSRLEREWKITKTNVTDNFSMDLTLGPCPIYGSISAANLRLLVDDDGDFSNGGTACYFNGDGTGIVLSYSNPEVTIANISTAHIPNNSTRFVTLASLDVLLPIELETFTANCIEGVVALNWATTKTTNNDYFTLEKSSDAIHFEPFAQINEQGNSSTTNYYEYTDEQPIYETTYYRLKQTDIDGRFSYSKIITATCESMEDIRLYPTVASDKTNLYLNSPADAMLGITVTDLNGRTVHYFEQPIRVGGNRISINTSRLSSGLYFVQVKHNGMQQVLKFIKTID